MKMKPGTKLRTALAKRGVFLLLALLLALPVAAEGGYANFQTSAEYTDGIFSDVAADSWYRDNIAAVYELGLMQGSGGAFRPDGDIRLSEALALAARLHSLYQNGTASFTQGEPWYQVYADYAVENGLFDASGADYDAAVTRRTFVTLLANALPESALPAVNEIADGQIPDVKMDAEGAAEIYRLYRAGVLTGNNSRGSFAPDTLISRAAVATILSRMAYRSLRVRFVLEEASYPDLYEQSAADDSFFSGSAMLGNSLAQGMMLYSGLNTMTYICKESIGVNSAETYIEELCTGSYDRVYIEFGINEIYMDAAAFADAYADIVARIQNAMPEAEIYVMALTPVTKERSDGGSFTMTRINAFNTALREMCAENACWFLDCCTPLEDGTGYLQSAYAGWDGSPHLSAAGYQAWAQVIRTYYA